MRTVRESEKFGSEWVEPGCLAREEHAPRLDPGRAGAHPNHLVVFGLDRDGVDAVSLEVLDETGARAFVLDQDRSRFPALLFGGDAPFQSGIFEPLPYHVED